MTASLELLADGMFAADASHGQSLALVVQHGGRTLYERYGTQPDTVFGPGEAVTPDTTLTMLSGERVMVKETLAEVTAKVIEFRQLLGGGARARGVLLLRVHLHALAQALLAAQHRDRRCGRRVPPDDRLGCGHRHRQRQPRLPPVAPFFARISAHMRKALLLSLAGLSASGCGNDDQNFVRQRL